MATAASLQKPAAAENDAKPWLWPKGQSGNPAGRPKGAKNQATVWAELFQAAASEAEALALVRLLLARALANETWALRFCLTRLFAPAKHRPVSFELPEPSGRGPAADAAAALRALLCAGAAGEVAPAEASPIADLIERETKAAEEEAVASPKPTTTPKPAATAPKPAAALKRITTAKTSAVAPPAAAAPSVFSSVLPPRPRCRTSRKEALLAGVSALALAAALDEMPPLGAAPIAGAMAA